MSKSRDFAIAALQGRERELIRARAHPVRFYLGEVVRAAAIAALALIIADAMAVEVVFAGAPRQRLWSVLLVAVILAAFRLLLARRERSRSDVIRALQQESK